jgi:cysteine desulfurase
LRNRLEREVLQLTPDAQIIGSAVPRLANTSCIALAGQRAETLVIRLDLAGVAVSAGAACSSGKVGASHVLAAMGLGDGIAAGALRVSLGHATCERDVEAFLRFWATLARSGDAATTNSSDTAPGNGRLKVERVS